MKTLELINAIQATATVVAPFNTNVSKIKNEKFINENEKNFFNKATSIQDKNDFINIYGNIIDTLSTWPFKKINYAFKFKVFNSELEKNQIINSIIKNGNIYKQYAEKQTLIEGRSLFTHIQVLTIENWLDKISKHSNDLSSVDFQNTIGISIGSGLAFLAISAILTGGLTLIPSIAGIGGVALLVNSGVHAREVELTKSKLNDYYNELSKILIIIKTSNDKKKEQELKQKIKEIILNVNRLTNNIINFNEFELTVDEVDSLTDYIIGSGY